MEHQIDAERIHHNWDNTLEPTLRVASGDVVHYDILMAGHGQVREGDTFEQTNFDFDTLYNLLGPLYVEGARPGDTLRIEILDLTPGDWGWCVQLPDLGTLPDQFPDPYLRTFDLRSGTHVDFAPDVKIPLASFLGTMGNHPDEPATASAFPPHKGAGNIDTRHLTAGSTLWLPVWCEGACSPAATRTPCRAMVKSALPRWSVTCGQACASRSSSARFRRRTSARPVR